MTTKRMVQLKTRPLTHIEFVNTLSTKIPVYREEETAFLCKYLNRTISAYISNNF